MSYGRSDEPPLDPGVTLVAGMVPLPDRRRPVLLFLLKPGQDAFYTGEFHAAGMRWLQQADQFNGRLLPRVNGSVMATGPLFPSPDATYELTSVAIRSAFSRAQFPFEQPLSVSGEWIESARPDGAVVALGPEWLMAHIDRAESPEDVAHILQEAAGRGDLVAGLLQVSRTGR